MSYCLLASAADEVRDAGHLPRQRSGQLVIEGGFGLEADQSSVELPLSARRVRPRDPVPAGEGRVEVAQKLIVDAGVVVDIRTDFARALDAEDELFPLFGRVVCGDVDLLALNRGPGEVGEATYDIEGATTLLGLSLQHDAEGIQSADVDHTLLLRARTRSFVQVRQRRPPSLLVIRLAPENSCPRAQWVRAP